jgi:Werner syndrome ATP-dependent helicase
MIDPFKINSSFDRPNLYMHISKKTKSINNDLKDILRKHKGESTIIYAKTRDMTNKISKSIEDLGVESVPYHAGLTTTERKEIQNKFMDNEITTIVATIAFGMGINHKNIRLVVQYGCSSNIEAYYQEIGRAGRDGKDSECYMFYSTKDFTLNRFFLKELLDEEKKSYRENEIVKMEKFVYSTDCRRKIILNHFGEEHCGNCSNCDNCNTSNQMLKYDFTEYAKLLFNVMKKLDNTFGGGQYILVLRGSNSKKINQNMKLMREYNKGSNKTELWWKEFIRLLIANSYLYEQSISGGFGSKLKMGQLAYEFLKNKSSNIRINVNEDFLRL